METLVLLAEMAAQIHVRLSQDSLVLMSLRTLLLMIDPSVLVFAEMESELD